jgi:hypothetical protein
MMGPRFDPHTNTWMEKQGRNVVGHCGECEYRIVVRPKPGTSAFHVCQALLDRHARSHYASAVEIEPYVYPENPEY